MVNDGLVLELMKIYADVPENFPRVLSAFLRRELLSLVKLADGQIALIESENNKDTRGRYVGEHLEDLADGIENLELFLEYFRDIPLGKNNFGVTTGEDVRIMLRDSISNIMSEREESKGKDWKLMEEDEFKSIKANTLKAAKQARAELDKLDQSLALDWTDSEPCSDYILE